MNALHFTLCIHIFITANGENKIHFMLQDILVKSCRVLPAVYHHGPCVWRIASFHPSKEGQEGSRVLGNPVVRPGRELKLPHFSLLAGAVLNMEVEEG